ncbi:MAG: XrtA/PEP-CTERM system amidotransferase [Alphaproteobacteria bacterium]
MCGIVGIFDSREARPIDRALLGRMNDSLAHRGPDGEGLHVGPGIGLGQRRLAIIDIAGGRQPIYNETGDVVVVFNGEIYNFQDVRAELERRGHRFATRSDTEVIVHGWEEWGPACVDRLRGMFAIALWDARHQMLFLARDRVGKKPLYYAPLADGRVLLGSELKALLLEPTLSRALDPTAVEDYLALGYVPDPKSIYASVRKLAPAHRLAWRRGRPEPTPERYWDVDFSATRPTSEADAVAALGAELAEAVRLRLIAEVPLGAFLSGGVDSSAVVTAMAALSAEPVETCSIAFGEAAYDESGYAEAVARRYGTRHHVRRVDIDDFDVIDRLATIYDEPFADSSAIPTYRVCGLARERVTVALSGDGGDEVFGGYARYRWHVEENRARAWLPGALGRAGFGLGARLWPDGPGVPSALRLKPTLAQLALDPVTSYFRSVATIDDGLRDRLVGPVLRRELQGYRAIEAITGPMRRAPTDDDLARVQYTDMHTYLPGDILVKVDRASMAHSLEVRVPWLDHGLMAWAATLPRSLKLAGREGKVLLKRAMEPRLPHDLLYRRKMGFAVPLATWFRGPLANRLRAALTSRRLAETGFFDMAAVERLVDEHQTGASDRGGALWALMMFEAFLRQVHDVRAADAAPVRRAAGVA